jgi:Phe-tRNA synthetase beta subunit B1 domain
MAPIATEEFDELCFEFGLELDEDVRNTDSFRPSIAYGTC